jgi:hypothetical protein
MGWGDSPEPTDHPMKTQIRPKLTGRSRSCNDALESLQKCDGIPV